LEDLLLLKKNRLKVKQRMQVNLDISILLSLEVTRLPPLKLLRDKVSLPLIRPSIVVTGMYSSIGVTIQRSPLVLRGDAGLLASFAS
jgi:hypothetical protein